VWPLFGISITVLVPGAVGQRRVQQLVQPLAA
jgi:hypothetical protein